MEGQRQSDDGYDVSATSATAATGTHRMSQLNIIESGGGAVWVLSAEQAGGGEKGEPLEEVFD